MTQEAIQTFTRRISAANRTQLITIVYEITLDYMNEMEQALTAGEDAALYQTFRLTCACVDDLTESLDLQYDLARHLQELYLFVKQQLLLAYAKWDAQALYRARRVIRALLTAWQEIEATDDSPPEIDNAQTVYAGLTYGRGTLNEDVQGLSGNRGMKA